jgi:cell division septal protein FtsQ
LRYLSLATIALLIAGTAAAGIFYIGIYRQKEISVIELTYEGFSFPIPESQLEPLNELKGMRYRDIDREQVENQLKEHKMLTDADLSFSYPDTLSIRLAARTPLVHLRLDREGFYSSLDGPGASNTVTDLLVTTDETVIEADSTLLTAVSNMVPTIEVQTREVAFPDSGRIDTQLRAFVRMLTELRQLEEEQYDQLQRLYFNTQNTRELGFILQNDFVRLSCIMVEPMSGRYFSDVLTTAVTAAGASGSQDLIRLTLLKDHAVLLSSN